MQERYYSKRDLLLTIFVWGAMIISFIPIVIGAINVSQVLWIMCVMWILLIAFVAWLWFGTYYEFKDKFLLVCSGPIKEKYYYPNITLIKSSHAYWSSTALSIDRLEVHYKGHLKGYISPKDKITFVEDLRKRCPHALIEIN